jgi:molybdenum cofactor biosynthesis enzyme MoaA
MRNNNSLVLLYKNNKISEEENKNLLSTSNMHISSLNIEIIDICNLKCNMCDIWKNKKKKIISIQEVTDLLSDENISKLTDLTLT